MFLSAMQRSLIERLINTIETGKPDGDYSCLSIYADGPHDVNTGMEGGQKKGLPSQLRQDSCQVEIEGSNTFQQFYEIHLT